MTRSGEREQEGRAFPVRKWNEDSPDARSVGRSRVGQWSTARELFGLSRPGCLNQRYRCHAVPVRARLQQVAGFNRNGCSGPSNGRRPRWLGVSPDDASGAEIERGIGGEQVPDRSVSPSALLDQACHPRRIRAFSATYATAYVRKRISITAATSRTFSLVESLSVALATFFVRFIGVTFRSFRGSGAGVSAPTGADLVCRITSRDRSPNDLWGIREGFLWSYSRIPS